MEEARIFLRENTLQDLGVRYNAHLLELETIAIQLRKLEGIPDNDVLEF